jgi:hypothetical protein
MAAAVLGACFNRSPLAFILCGGDYKGFRDKNRRWWRGTAEKKSHIKSPLKFLLGAAFAPVHNASRVKSYV